MASPTGLPRPGAPTNAPEAPLHCSHGGGFSGGGPFREALAKLLEEHEQLEARCQGLAAENSRLCALLPKAKAAAAVGGQEQDCMAGLRSTSVDEWAQEAAGVMAVPAASEGELLGTSFETQTMQEHLMESRAHSREGGRRFELDRVWRSERDLVQGWGGSLKHFMNNQLLPSKPNHENISVVPRTSSRLEQITGRCDLSAFVISPNSTAHLLWDVSGLILITYDVLTVPMMVFDPPRTTFSIVMEWVTLLFWTLDMIQSFAVGFYERGHLIMAPARIIWRYLTTWFCLDLLVVSFEWVMIIADDRTGSNLAGLGRIFRGFRAIRVLRLLRLLKLQQFINMIYDFIGSEYTFVCVNLIRLLTFIFVLNHVIACLWFLVGKLTMDRGMRNWIESSGSTDAVISYQYFSALHWSLTQFTPASIDISARNVPERIFSIVVLFFAMVAFSSVVGTVTTSITNLRNLRSSEMKQFWMIRTYFKQNSISRELSQRILRYLQYHIEVQGQRMQAPNIPFLSKLSGSLGNELIYELHSPHLLQHPFFEYVGREMAGAMHSICTRAVKPISLAAGDVLFHAGDDARCAFFLKLGNFEYTWMAENICFPPLRQREWISEAVLWTSWRHLGELCALSPGELLAVDPAKFAEVMCEHPRPWYFCRCYGTQFVEFLNTAEQGDLSDVLRDDRLYIGMVSKSDRSRNGHSVYEEGDGASVASSSAAVN